ncbi:MAG: cell division protein SepF [Clostridia bacterium]|nr:cell division protein SepF [Clostridia bacterium]
MKEFLNSIVKFVTGEELEAAPSDTEASAEVSENGAPSEKVKKETKKSRISYSSRKEKESAEERAPRYTDTSSNSSYSFGSASKNSEYDSSRNRSRLVNMSPAGNQNMIITAIKEYSDCKDIVRQLKEKKSVIINVDQMDKVTAKRVVDFLSGAITAIDGDIKKISNSIVVVAPSNIKLTGMLGEEIPSNINEAFLGND